MNILADASLPGLAYFFAAPFRLSTYNSHLEVPKLLQENDVLLCRSTLHIGADLLANQRLKYVATASSGTDHIDHAFLKTQSTELIDAKGSNASSVAEFVLACLNYLSREHLIQGNRVGIVGMGHVGRSVYRGLEQRFQLQTYDPPRAMQDPHFTSCDKETLYTCDVLCIHCALHAEPPYPSLNLLNEEFLAHLKPGCVLINAARGGVVNETALLQQNKLIYCTDVYLNEPQINPKIVDYARLCTPHIAGHSVQAKFAALAQVSTKLHQYADIPVPQFAIPTAPFARIPYDPIQETVFLKKAADKKAAFLHLRKNHLRYESLLGL